MGANVLRDVMERRYHEIKTLFKRASKTHGLRFSEDTFSDSYIKCYNALQTKTLTEQEVIKYLWSAFVNNTKKTYRNIKYNIDIVDFLEENDIPDISYDERRYITVDIILDAIKKEFDENEVKAWYMHFAENKSYEDLIKLGYSFNFHNVFRNINNYIKNKLPKINREYKNLITEILKK